MESEYLMTDIGKTGLTPVTAKNMVFGAGVLYKNFFKGTHYTQTFDTEPVSGKTYYYISGGPGGISYTEFDGDHFSIGTIYYEKYEGYGGDKIGATTDGTKLTITPEFKDIETDGVTVKMKGLTIKTGEKAVIEATVLELDEKNAASAVCGNIFYDNTESYVVTKSNIENGDYISNLAFVARRLDDGKHVIVIFKNALVTSGFSVASKTKEASGSKFTFEAFADTTDESADKLPVKIIFERS